jgi:hypothetical protein
MIVIMAATAPLARSGVVTRPEPDNYDKKRPCAQYGKAGGVANWIPDSDYRENNCRALNHLQEPQQFPTGWVSTRRYDLWPVSIRPLTAELAFHNAPTSRFERSPPVHQLGSGQCLTNPEVSLVYALRRVPDIPKRRIFFMKKFAVGVLLSAGLVLAGCGSGNNNSGNVNGNWTAALTDSNNNPVFAFSTSLVASNNGSSLTISNLTFTTNDPSCSITEATETGSFMLSGNFNGNVTGKFLFNITSGNGNNADLSLTGTANGGTISGTWSLVGGTVSCTGSGNFTMTKV